MKYLKLVKEMGLIREFRDSISELAQKIWKTDSSNPVSPQELLDICREQNEVLLYEGQASCSRPISNYLERMSITTVKIFAENIWNKSIY